jgi:hypothetical protein
MQDDMEPFKRWLKSSLLRDRRKADRRDAPELVAHYWDGACPVEHTIRNISRNGVYLLTEQRWYPGTMILLTLQRKNTFDDDANRSITVQSRVVRSGSDGVGLAFVPYQEIRPHGSRAAEAFQIRTAPQKAISGFVERLRNGNGSRWSSMP